MIVVNSKMKRKKKRKEKQLSIKQVKRGYVYWLGKAQFKQTKKHVSAALSI